MARWRHGVPKNIEFAKLKYIHMFKKMSSFIIKYNFILRLLVLVLMVFDSFSTIYTINYQNNTEENPVLLYFFDIYGMELCLYTRNLLAALLLFGLPWRTWIMIPLISYLLVAIYHLINIWGVLSVI
jgi:hypothetical protein